MKDKKVIGGHDTCNEWGLSDHPGLIVMTAQECPSDDIIKAYWGLARGKKAIYTQHGNKLIAKAGGHIGVFQKA